MCWTHIIMSEQWKDSYRLTHTHAHNKHTHSVGKKQWCIPAHISPAGDNCAISQRVAETLFTACCGGVGGGYELMSSERKTTSSHTQIQITHTHSHTHIQIWTHRDSTHKSADCLSSADKQAALAIGIHNLLQQNRTNVQCLITLRHSQA